MALYYQASLKINTYLQFLPGYTATVLLLSEASRRYDSRVLEFLRIDIFTCKVPRRLSLDQESKIL
jgi:hypothetical protein